MTYWSRLDIRNRLGKLLEMAEKGSWNYQDIAEILAEEFPDECGGLTRSSVRHAAQRYFPKCVQKTNTELADDDIDRDEKLIEEDDVKSEISKDKEVLRMKMNHKNLEKKYQHVLKDQVLQDSIIEVVKDNLQTLPNVKPPERLKIKYDKKSKEKLTYKHTYFCDIFIKLKKLV